MKVLNLEFDRIRFTSPFLPRTKQWASRARPLWPSSPPSTLTNCFEARKPAWTLPFRNTSKFRLQSSPSLWTKGHLVPSRITSSSSGPTPSPLSKREPPYSPFSSNPLPRRSRTSPEVAPMEPRRIARTSQFCVIVTTPPPSSNFELCSQTSSRTDDCSYDSRQWRRTRCSNLGRSGILLASLSPTTAISDRGGMERSM